MLTGMLLFAAGSLSGAPIIEDIVIRGNKNVVVEDILENLAIALEDEYDYDKISEDLRVLYGMEEIEDVSVFQETISTGTIRIIYEIMERPVVNEILFKGNDNISTRRLRDKIQLGKDNFLDSFILDQDVKDLEEHYRDEGFSDARVEAYTTTLESENEVSVTYFVNEGSKIAIKEINIIGVVEGDYDNIIKKIDLKDGDVFREDKLNEGLQEIESYYRDSGYFNVNISHPVITYSPERKYMYVTVFISENKKFTLADVGFSGNTQFTDKELEQTLLIEEGDIFSEQNLKLSLQRIQEKYGKKGYIKASIMPNFYFFEEEEAISVNIEIREGPMVFVRNIYLDGNHKTRDYVIERELQIQEGDPFKLGRIRKSQEEIFKLGFFRDVQIDMLPAESPDQTDVVFKLEEQKTGTASIGAGYSTQDALVGNLQVSQDNLFGRGQRLSAMWEFGSEKQNYRVHFREPYLLNTRTPFSVSLYNTQRKKYYTRSSYREQRRGGDLSFGRHFTTDLTGSMKYSLEHVNNYSIPNQLKGIISDESETVSSVTPGLTYDTRDYPFNPRRGSYLSVTNQIAGGIFGGSSNFNKFETRTTYFQSLFWKFTGVLNLNTGALFSHSDSQKVPEYERFYVGGAESVRGYEYWDDIGPPGGGRYKLVGNAEIKFPIISERGQTILQGALFYDIGGVWENLDEINLSAGLKKDKLKRGFGVGIRFKTRAFPIRLDWGYGLDKSPKEGQWYFTLGDIF